MVERQAVLNWWTGRLSDEELARFSGMEKRAVAFVLSLDHFEKLVRGRGRGSRHTRRLDRQARDAIPIVSSLNQCGIGIECATNILAATPFLASTATEVVDFSPLLSPVTTLSSVDPSGGWLPSDVVPRHVWDRHILLCHDVANPAPSAGEIYQLEEGEFIPNTPSGTMVVDRSADALPSVEIKPLTGKPTYKPDFDQYAFYNEGSNVVAMPRFDGHLIIVDGRWIFYRSPRPSPMDVLYGGVHEKNYQFEHSLVSIIEPDRKTVRRFDGDDLERRRAEYWLKTPTSLIDINIALAVRKMKRRAYGLSNDGDAT